VERTEPGLILGERPALEAWLDFHRDTLLLRCAGLTAGLLVRPGRRSASDFTIRSVSRRISALNGPTSIQ
jgi:hypothetical protein